MAAGLTVLAGPQVAYAADVSPDTRANTLTAMHGEAFAHASYLAYAQEAERTGEPEVAALFRATAATELDDHFTAEAELIGFVGSDVENLEESIAGEEFEATVSYPDFAAQARRDGCAPAVALFTELAGDEAAHAGRFRTALEAITDPGSGAEIPTGEVVEPVPIRAVQPQCSGQTRENLYETLRGEAFAYAKYTLYARAAGVPRLAELWTNTANQELGEHFAETANLYGLVRTNTDNLRHSIDGEVYEATVMYPSFARHAAAAGDAEAAALFREISFDEADHASAFLRALVGLVVPGGGEDQVRPVARPAGDRAQSTRSR
ncbi:ferritin family protein [Micromonospora sp. WMMA1923]|uniref:ferritin family protein n=1 Tax=Micromonospora sp. WMMA1923 TaxID=3404125 RepID=UPI003B957958